MEVDWQRPGSWWSLDEGDGTRVLTYLPFPADPPDQPDYCSGAGSSELPIRN